MSAVLASVIVRRQMDYTEALNEMRDLAPDALHASQALREAIELVGCLRRLLPNCTVDQIHKAFGAPGDFGYDTAIGDALARLYSGRP